MKNSLMSSTPSKTFSLDTIQKGRRKVPIKALIYGPNGIGKSYFASDFPKPLFMDVERNIEHVKGARQVITGWQDSLAFLDFLIHTDHTYETLIVDSLDQLESYARELACKNAGISNLNESYGKGPIELAKLFEAFRNKCHFLFEKKQMHILLIAHEKMKRIQDVETGPRDIIVPSINSNAAPVFLDWCNLIGYAHNPLMLTSSVEMGSFGKEQRTASFQQEYVDKDGQGLGKRLLRIVKTLSPNIICKEPFGLEEELESTNGCIKLDAKTLLKYRRQFYDNLKHKIQKGE